MSKDCLIHFSDGSEAVLVHHGILGQKWGIRRYQNYDGTYTSEGKKRKSAREMSDEELRVAINRKRLENQYNQLRSQTGGYRVANNALSTSGKILRTTASVANVLAKKNQIKSADKIEEIEDNEFLSKKQKKAAKKEIIEYQKQRKNEIVSNAANTAAGIANTGKFVIKPNENLGKISDKELKKYIDRMALEAQYNDLYKVNKGKEYLDSALGTIGTVSSVAGSTLSLYLILRELNKG